MGKSDRRTPVAVLGATGVVGQRIIQLLDGHPWFEVKELIASDRSAGNRYEDATVWVCSEDMPAPVSDITLKNPGAALDSPIVFSAVSSDVARQLEPNYAKAGHRVVSNASAFRGDPSVPLLVPEVNASAIEEVTAQEWSQQGGGLVTNPNCSVVGLVLALYPIHLEYEIESVTVVTLQAISGAGLPGIPAMEIAGNVIPHIPREAEKISTEPQKILGSSFPISVAVHRVPVVDGHTLAVFLKTRKSATTGDMARALAEFAPVTEVASLPSAPSRPIVVVDRADRPQPRLDATRANGMAVTVGHVFEDPSFDARFGVVVHNTIRGAAGAAMLNAELWERSVGGR